MKKQYRYPCLTITMHPVADLALHDFIVAEAKREGKTKARYVRDLLRAMLQHHLPPTNK